MCGPLGGYGATWSMVAYSRIHATIYDAYLADDILYTDDKCSIEIDTEQGYYDGSGTASKFYFYLKDEPDEFGRWWFSNCI